MDEGERQKESGSREKKEREARERVVEKTLVASDISLPSGRPD
jgi:hypothetical protein